MAYLGKNPIPCVTIGERRYSYRSLERIIKDYGNYPIIEGKKLNIDYFNARGDIKVKFLNKRTLQVEGEVILKYHPEYCY